MPPYVVLQASDHGRAILDTPRAQEVLQDYVRQVELPARPLPSYDMLAGQVMLRNTDTKVLLYVYPMPGLPDASTCSRTGRSKSTWAGLPKDTTLQRLPCPISRMWSSYHYPRMVFCMTEEGAESVLAPAPTAEA